MTFFTADTYRTGRVQSLLRTTTLRHTTAETATQTRTMPASALVAMLVSWKQSQVIAMKNVRSLVQESCR